MSDQIPTEPPRSRRRQRVEDEGYVPPQIDINVPSVEESTSDDKRLSKSQIASMWRSRKWMAWFSLLSVVVFTGLLFVVDDTQKLELLVSVMTWFYGAMVTIVGVFMGLRSWASFRGK